MTASAKIQEVQYTLNGEAVAAFTIWSMFASMPGAVSNYLIAILKETGQVSMPDGSLVAISNAI
jgi:hypothetical protein